MNNRDVLKEKIKNGEISLKINPEKQNPHIFEHRKENRSYFTISIEELQRFLNSNYATGQVTISRSGQIKEIIFIDKFIGFDVGENEKEVATNGFKVHYSKGRTHLVPYRKRLEKIETI